MVEDEEVSFIQKVHFATILPGMAAQRSLFCWQHNHTNTGTLVVCPVIALTQWKTEIEKFTDGSLTICTYHGPNRESETPREMLKKYDVVLTTYQVVEADFRKMTSPNRVTCPNCGGKFKIDKLPIHLKYFCGETAQKTEAQARQQRNSDREGSSRRRGRRPDRPFGKSPGKKDKKDDVAVLKKFKSETTAAKKQASTKANTQKQASAKKAATAIASAAVAKKLPAAQKKAASKKSVEKTDADVGRPGSKRSAARKAATQISKTAAEWMPPDDDSGSDVSKSEEPSSDEESEMENTSAESDVSSSDSDSDNSALQRARIKQQKALDRARSSNGKKKSITPAKKDAKKSFAKNGKKKFDDDSSSSDESEDDGGAGNDIDMDALVVEAMEGGEFDLYIRLFLSSLGVL